MAAGVLFQGRLRQNPRSTRVAYVSPEVTPGLGLPLGVGMDVMLEGPKDRNRALEGDVVVVRLHPPELWGGNNNNNRNSNNGRQGGQQQRKQQAPAAAAVVEEALAGAVALSLSLSLLLPRVCVLGRALPPLSSSSEISPPALAMHPPPPPRQGSPSTTPRSKRRTRRWTTSGRPSSPP